MRYLICVYRDLSPINATPFDAIRLASQVLGPFTQAQAESKSADLTFAGFDNLIVRHD